MSSQHRSRDTRNRFEQWLKNPQCTANTISAVKGFKMASIAQKEGVKETRAQSVFAVQRGNVFEAFILRNEAEYLVKELRENKLLTSEEYSFHDFRIARHGGKYRNHDASLAAVKDFFDHFDAKAKQNLMVGVTIRIPGGGMLPEAILVVDVMLLIKTENGFEAIIGEIKSFPDREGYTNPHNLSAARAQAGIYVHGLRIFLSNECSSKDIKVSDTGFLVFSKPGSNFPSVRAGEDFKYQAMRASRGFKHLQDVADSLSPLSKSETEKKLLHSDTDYSPGCFQFCDRAPACLEKATVAERPIVLGEDVAKFVGEISLKRVIELVNGGKTTDETEIDFVKRFQELEGSKSVKKIRAYEKGKPLPRREKKMVRVLPDNQTVYLSFIRMGGESLPWGISWSKGLGKAQTLAIPDPWDLNELPEMLKTFEAEISKILNHPSISQDARPDFQIIVPNHSHLEMMQNIAFRFTYAKRGDDDHRETLNRLGRIFTFFTLEAQRPGQQLVIVASELLKEHYTFPADNLRQGHLGFLLALLKTKGTLSAKYAAGKIAETSAVGITMNPEVEQILEPMMEELKDAKRIKDPKTYKLLGDKIIPIIETELLSRIDLAKSAISFFREDERVHNEGTTVLWNDTNYQINNYYKQEVALKNGDIGYFKSPWTDRDPYNAAIAYNEREHDEDKYLYALLPHDKEIQGELISSGDALIGKLIKIEHISNPTAMRASTTMVVWVIETDLDQPLRIREKGDIAAIGHPRLNGYILSIETNGKKKIIRVRMGVKRDAEDIFHLHKTFTFASPAPNDRFIQIKRERLRSAKKAS